MDEMKISSGFLTGILSKIVKKTIKKKFGRDIDVKLNELKVNFNNEGKATVHLSADASLEKNELLNILKGVGLD